MKLRRSDTEFGPLGTWAAISATTRGWRSSTANNVSAPALISDCQSPCTRPANDTSTSPRTASTTSASSPGLPSTRRYSVAVLDPSRDATPRMLYSSDASPSRTANPAATIRSTGIGGRPRPLAGRRRVSHHGALPGATPPSDTASPSVDLRRLSPGGAPDVIPAASRT